MIIVGNCILSEAAASSYFCCDLKQCKGICCIEGDAGAPLEEEEAGILENSIEEIKPFMTEAGIHTIENGGAFDYDMDGNLCTPLNSGEECAFLIMEGDIARCAVEKAWEQKKITFQKPISCHLYPIRITEYDNFTALNYHEWHICRNAKKNGQKEKIPLYQFLKTPLIRKFGKEWYAELEEKMENKISGG